MMRKIFSFLFLSFLFSHTSGMAFAEVTGELLISPKNPNPFDEVTISLQSYSFDTDAALITWTVGNTVVSSGLGQKNIKLRLGAAGSQLALTVRARGAGGEDLRLGTTITPQSVSLVWESPESYVPPFYEGKALPGEGSTLHVFALPEIVERGRRVPTADLSYSWYVNDKFISSSSGRGKSVLVTKLDYLSSEHTIKVVVRSGSGFQAEQTITIETREPLVTYYLHDSLLGTDYGFALGRRFEATKEFTLEVVPYFLSLKDALAFSGAITWSLDGAPIQEGMSSLLTLRPGEQIRGSRVLTTNVEQTKRRLQKAAGRIEVVFDTRK